LVLGKKHRRGALHGFALTRAPGHNRSLERPGRFLHYRQIMLDFVCALLLYAFILSVVVAYVVLFVVGRRASNARLEGHGGVMLGRGAMEATYVLFGPLVRLLLALRVTPNTITAFSLVPALLSGVALARGHFGLGAMLATASAFCDMLDGILARRLKLTSDLGELFDATVDRYVEFFLLAGLAFYFRETPAIQILTLGAILGSFMVSYATAKAEALGVAPPKGAMRRAERAVYLIFGCAFVPLAGLLWPPMAGGSPLRLGREIPIELAILVVATVTNVSAVRRLSRVADSLRARPA
jgi:phosphatidylglycerophosphate synthase